MMHQYHDYMLSLILIVAQKKTQIYFNSKEGPPTKEIRSDGKTHSVSNHYFSHFSSLEIRVLVKERVFAGRGTHDGKTDAIIARYNPRRMNKVPYPPNGVSPLNPLYTSNMQ